MATTAEFRNGLCINYNGDPWKIESFQHVKPGKGPAFVRTKIRNLNTGRLLENTFTSGVKIDIIRIENRKYQFLYADGNDYHLMNNDDYEQISELKNGARDRNDQKLWERWNRILLSSKRQGAWSQSYIRHLYIIAYRHPCGTRTALPRCAMYPLCTITSVLDIITISINFRNFALNPLISLRTNNEFR